ncbi:MAG: hypothetical protein HYV29_01875 [Ignavibacteriales bacterium]|nr:hypothetical protein [Ignavibacteriales bacterium]
MTMVKYVEKYLLTFFLCSCILSAQSFLKQNEPKRLTQYAMDRWQVKEGLPQNSVNAIVQTHDGYLWLGTYEGLVRFNGRTFTVFDRGNTPALLSNRITSLSEDKKGRLWIGSYGGGVTMYDAEGFHTPVRDTSMGLFVSIASMTADTFGRVWTITEKGLYCIRDTVIEYYYPVSQFGYQVPINIVADAKGRIWVWTYITLYVIEKGTVVECVPERPQHTFSPAVPSRDSSVWFFEYSPDGTGRIGKYGRRRSYLDSIPREFMMKGVFPLFEDSRGVLWCYLREGIATYYNGAWDRLVKANGFPPENVQTVVEDTEGSLWLGTNGSGLLRFRDSRFTPIGIAEGLLGENVWAVFEDSRRTKWIGTLTGGGWCYTIDRNGIRRVANKAGIYFCFLEDKEGNIWLEGESLVTPDGKRRGLNRSFFSSVLALDSTGRIWLSPLHGGIYIVENETIIDSISLGNAVANSTIRTMKADRDGSIWIGTQSGLFHCRNNNITQYTTANGLPNNWIRSIYQDSAGTLWIATDGGLAKRVNGRFTSYTVNNGLHSNTIHVILEDDSGRMWMSSNKGIFVIKKNDLLSFDEGKISLIPCMVYGEEDGMRSAEGNGSYQQGGWKMHDGTLWFATIKGIVIVDPNDLKENRIPPPVYIERVVVNGKEISATTKFELQYPVNDITIQYAALSYRVHARVRYTYMLEGYHDGWIEAGNQTRATFTNLPAGDYDFRVIACNDDGVWNSTGASLAFTLPAPFWQTWWFYGTIIMITFGAFAGMIRYYELRKVKRRIEQLEHEQALERERSRISKDMHDEVGSSLTQIAILSELAKRGEQKESQSHLEKISTTSREVIDNISQIIWAVDPKNDTLENLLAYTREYISETVEMMPMRCELRFPDRVFTAKVSAEFRRNIFLTVKEAVNNAVKYSRAATITTTVVVSGDQLTIDLQDDGIGFSAGEVSRFGNGLNNMKKRIQDLHGILSIDSERGRGTHIRITVPITTFV